MSILFYHKEWVAYDDAYNVKLNSEQACKVFRKLVRHYDLGLLKLRFYKGRGGRFNYGRWDVKLSRDACLGVLCHEIAHAIDWKKRGFSRHDRKMFKLVGRVIAYCQKNTAIREICLS